MRVVLPRVIDIDEPFPPLAGSLDFLGINYYTRDLVVGALSGPNVYTPAAVPDHPRNDLGWEVYPEGLYRLLRRYARRGWPLVVTENGVADGRDVLRADFLRAHLYAVDRARAEGVDVVGYIYWSLIDNFEWSHGDARPLRALLDRLRRPRSDPPADLGGRHVSRGGAEPRHAAIGPRRRRRPA